MPTAKLAYDTSAKPSPARSTPLHYRLDVLASSAADVVESTGGWLFDRVLAGWRVHVLVPAGTDAAALHILGVTVGDLNSHVAALTGQPHQDQAHSIAVAAELCARDASVLAAVASATQRRRTEIAIWGDADAATELSHQLQPAYHRLSGAARAFKARALNAARAGHPDIATVEHFSCTSTRHVPDDRDLVSGAKAQLLRGRS